MKKKQKRKKIDLPRRYKKWTKKEIALLRKLYPDTFTHELVERMGRSVNALAARAILLGVKKSWRKYNPDISYHGKSWTQKEIDLLIKLYPITPIRQLRRRFPRRSKDGIIGKAHSLDLKKNYLRTPLPPASSRQNLWREQKKRLIDLYPTMSNRELAKKFGRTERAISSAAEDLGLHKTGYSGNRKGGNSRVWSKEEDAIVKKLYPATWTRDLAVQLGRTKKSVSHRAAFLGLKKYPEKFTSHPLPMAWSDQDIKKLRQLWKKGYKISHIAEIIEKNRGAVRQQILRQRRDFGLPKRREPGKPWSAKEEKYLIRYYNKKS
jgi:hypothetical protein